MARLLGDAELEVLRDTTIAPQEFISSLGAAEGVLTKGNQVLVVNHLHEAFAACPTCRMPAPTAFYVEGGNGIVESLRLYQQMEDRELLLRVMRQALLDTEARISRGSRAVFVGAAWHTLQYEHIAVSKWGVAEWITVELNPLKAALGSRSGRALTIDARAMAGTLGEASVDVVVCYGVFFVERPPGDNCAGRSLMAWWRQRMRCCSPAVCLWFMSATSRGRLRTGPSTDA